MITNWIVFLMGFGYIGAGINFIIIGSPKLGLIYFFYAGANFILCTMK